MSKFNKIIISAVLLSVLAWNVSISAKHNKSLHNTRIDNVKSKNKEKNKKGIPRWARIMELSFGGFVLTGLTYNEIIALIMGEKSKTWYTGEYSLVNFISNKIKKNGEKDQDENSEADKGKKYENYNLQKLDEALSKLKGASDLERNLAKKEILRVFEKFPEINLSVAIKNCKMPWVTEDVLDLRYYETKDFDVFLSICQNKIKVEDFEIIINNRDKDCKLIRCRVSDFGAKNKGKKYEILIEFDTKNNTKRSKVSVGLPTREGGIVQFGDNIVVEESGLKKD